MPRKPCSARSPQLPKRTTMLHPARLTLCATLLASATSAQSLIKDLNPTVQNGNGIASTFTPVVSLGAIAFFPGNDGVNGVELWKTDGTSTGTVMVKDINTTSP